MTVAGDDEALARAGPALLDRLRHGGGRLAGADDDGAARRAAPAGAGRIGLGRRGRRERGLEQGEQQRLALDDPLR